MCSTSSMFRIYANLDIDSGINCISKFRLQLSDIYLYIDITFDIEFIVNFSSLRFDYIILYYYIIILSEASNGQPDNIISSHKRFKRQFANSINDDNLDWYMGLILDGIKNYLNLSELCVSESPTIHPFDPEIRVLKIHQGEKYITFKVSNVLIIGRIFISNIAYTSCDGGHAIQ